MSKQLAPAGAVPAGQAPSAFDIPEKVNVASGFHMGPTPGVGGPYCLVLPTVPSDPAIVQDSEAPNG